ncbi:MAG TPA: response regulator [Terriglobales bacterium]|nr:response regulator [Terriglobales bacterium]
MAERAGEKRFAPGELSPRSGVYRITHDGHRPDHEAVVMGGVRFPQCRICGHAVRFELVLATKGSAATQSQNPSILIAGSEPARNFRTILAERGYSVSVAADATQARRQLQQTPCDVVITPLDLGQSRSGLELARLAKQLDPKPLIFIYTSDPTTEAMREILRTRVDYCALEPLNVNEVSTALDTLMARRSL